MSCCRAFSDRMLLQYVARYERGEVQSRPRLRFVDAEGRACLAAALCGARSAAEVAGLAAEAGGFPGGPLERVSRRFEAGELRSAEFYDEVVLELTRRRAEREVRSGTRPAVTPAGVVALA